MMCSSPHVPTGHPAVAIGQGTAQALRYPPISPICQSHVFEPFVDRELRIYLDQGRTAYHQ